MQEVYYLHYDQVGTLKAVSDGYLNVIKEISYDTYGNILSETNPSFKVPFGFAGGLYDADTKLTRFGYRDYDAYSGKWTAKDPIDFGGGDSNLYGYVLQNPVSLFDANGLLPYDTQGAESLRYWVDRAQTNPAWYGMAFFAALWTPETSEDTTCVIIGGLSAGNGLPAILKSKAAGAFGSTIRTSRWSQLFGSKWKTKYKIPTFTRFPPKYKTTPYVGRAVARWLPFLGYSVLTGEAVKLYNKNK